VFLTVATLSTLGIGAVAIAATRKSPTEFIRLAGLDQIRWRWIWQPFLLMIAAYVGVFVYAESVRALGIELLVPDDTTPRSALRDGATFAAFGVLALIAAPLGEEILYRGLVFGGALNLGFLPAALISGFLFALSHVDPGTFIPFTAIGVMFAWLAWQSRSLWPNIICHAFFNGASFLALALTG